MYVETEIIRIGFFLGGILCDNDNKVCQEDIALGIQTSTVLQVSNTQSKGKDLIFAKLMHAELLVSDGTQLAAKLGRYGSW